MNNATNPDKTTLGTFEAQTPSSAPAPDQIGTLDGAVALAVTATNQSSCTAGTPPCDGGGRCVSV